LIFILSRQNNVKTKQFIIEIRISFAGKIIIYYLNKNFKRILTGGEIWIL